MEKEKSAVALGLFDGIHLGHRAVLNLALEQKKNGLTPCVFTFNPAMVSKKSGGEYGYIYTHLYKLKMLYRLGFSWKICSVQFQEVCGFSGEEFVKNILIDRLNAGFVCCGNNFRFGKDASCGVNELYEFGEKYGFEVCIADDVVLDGEIVSSTAVRNMLLSGDTAKARQFLGEPYTIDTTVVHGAELGRTIGFPTINQPFSKGQLVLKYGVYASDVCIDEKWYRAMTNIGIKPTVSCAGVPLAETHIIGFSGDLYGRNIQVNIRKFIRPEQKFESVDELKRQITKDMEIIQHLNIENS